MGTGSLDPKCSAASSVAGALKVAMKLHNNDATTVIMDFLVKCDGLRRLMPYEVVNELVTTCILNDNTYAIIPALKLVQNLSPVDSTITDCILSGYHIKVLLEKGRRKTLQYLIEKGQVNPRSFTPFQLESRFSLKSTTPLQLSLDSSRYDLAELLLENGADVDGCLPNSKQTSLHAAVAAGSTHQIRFLLLNGANPGRSDDPHCPWGLALLSQDYIGLYLIQVSVKHGVEYLRRPDFLEGYGGEELDEFNRLKRNRWDR